MADIRPSQLTATIDPTGCLIDISVPDGGGWVSRQIGFFHFTNGLLDKTTYDPRLIAKDVFDSLNIDYSNTVSGLTADNVQAAIDELDVFIDQNIADIIALQTGSIQAAINLGTGEGIYAQKNGTNLEFKSIRAGNGISITSDSTSLLIESTGVKGSSGLNWGCNVTINAGDNTTFDCSAGEITIVDSYTNPETISIQTIAIPASSANPLPDIAIRPITFIGLNATSGTAGNFILSASRLNEEQIRDIVPLVVAQHNDLVTIAKIADVSKNYNRDHELSIVDMTRALGTDIKFEGFELSPNGINQNFNIAAGRMFSLGANKQNNLKSPNVKDIIAKTPVSFLIGTATGSSVATNIVPTDNYDADGLGTLVAIPTGAFIMHRVFYDSSLDTVFIQYGQNLYDSQKKAVDVYRHERFVQFPAIASTFDLGGIIVRQGVTDLSDEDLAKFITFGKFGCGTHERIPSVSRFAEVVELGDGLSYQRQDIQYIVDTGQIFAEVEAVGGGDITYIFKQKEHRLDCTTGTGTGGKARVLLTQGISENAPAFNYIYVTPNGDAVNLLASTSRPTGEFAYLGEVYLQDQVNFTINGELMSRRYTDSKEFGGRSTVQRTNERLRVLPADYELGILQNVIVDTAPAPDTVNFTTTAGQVWQKHLQDFPIRDGSTDGIYIVNHPTTPFKRVTDLNDPELLQTANGDSLSGRRFNWVVWGSQNSSQANCKTYINLPNDSYGNNPDAIADVNQTAIITIPKEFRGTGFLIARLPFRHRTVGGGQYSNLAQDVLGIPVIDLRGQLANVGAGGSAIPASNEFLASLFRVTDDTTSNQLIFNLAALLADRTLTMPDASGTLVLQALAQALTNKTIDASLNTISNLLHGTQLDAPQANTGVTHGHINDQAQIIYGIKSFFNNLFVLGNLQSVGITTSSNADFGGQVRGGIEFQIFSATPTFNMNFGNVHEMTLTADVTSLSISNAVAGTGYVIYLKQDATGGWVIPTPDATFGTPTTNSVAAFLTGANNVNIIQVLIDPSGTARWTLETSNL